MCHLNRRADLARLLLGFSCELRLALIADCASLMAGEYQGASDEVYRKLVEEPRAIGGPSGTSREKHVPLDS